MGENLKGRDHLEDLGIDVTIILHQILKKYGLRVWTGFIRHNTGSHCGRLRLYFTSSSIKGGEIVQELSNYPLPQYNSRVG
jgi:hypothetical protein